MSSRRELEELRAFRKKALEDNGATITTDRYGIPIIRAGLGGHFIRGAKTTEVEVKEVIVEKVVERPAETVIDTAALAAAVAEKLQGSLTTTTQLDTSELLNKIKDMFDSGSIAGSSESDIINALNLNEPDVFISSKEMTSNFNNLGDESKTTISDDDLDMLFDMIPD